jgi:hypothetical protein
MKPNLRMRLCSLGEGGCPVGVLPGKRRISVRKRSGLVLLLTGRGTRRLGDWISGTRDAAA